jgi:serine/threonine protein kinase
MLADSTGQRIADQVCLGLAHAHSFGIIHRDVKPDNLLLSGDAATSDVVMKIADFGIAKTFGLGEGLTATGEIVGARRYMAPGQLIPGEDVGPASDLYALGLVLREMLTEEMSPDSAPRAAKPPATGSKRSAGASAKVLARAMAHSPRDRFTDAEQMAIAIASIA